ncbi:uncharacterized protein LOC129763234 [Toxorhynchites rutilus septentrionalis]|uniref:uncharacterized protein LOC129763234 n=1 Tax=Toxorhynchites rutilus septentrionalis TaxID=329112 RepID=UPI00247AD3DC|nr:uncharacterized protein LOC129763234 [Toxorhynchites rutilus septentrionalis]
MIPKCAAPLLLLLVGLQLVVSHPYANNYPYSTAVVLESSVSKGASSKGAAEGGKDLRNFNSDHSFDAGESINSAADAARYHTLDNQLNSHRIADAARGGSMDKVKLSTGENYEADKSHNRKYVKSGFTNSYHKDENGSKSSYYEDSDDRGGKQVFDNRQNMKNDYNDHLYNKELKNNQLRDWQDDRFGGVEQRGVRDFHRQSAADRGNQHDYRDGYRDDRDQHVRGYGHEVHPMPHLPPVVPLRNNYDDLYQRRSFYEPRPAFTTGQSRIVVYEDPREYIYDYPTDDRDGFMRRYDEGYSAERARIDFRPSPLVNYGRY